MIILSDADRKAKFIYIDRFKEVNVVKACSFDIDPTQIQVLANSEKQTIPCRFVIIHLQIQINVQWANSCSTMCGHYNNYFINQFKFSFMIIRINIH